MNFWAGEHIHVLEGWHTPIPTKKKFLHFGHFWILPYVPHYLELSMFIYILHNKLANVSKDFPELCEPF